jgi:hypothetical protein
LVFQKTLHAFEAAGSTIKRADDFVPVNKKFNVVIRLLDKRISSENNKFTLLIKSIKRCFNALHFSMEPYYGDYEGIEKVTLTVAGSDETSFTVPKIDLFRASPVFQRMFANEMTEKATGKVDKIKETNPEEFGDFLRAISPKQELPNRQFY